MNINLLRKNDRNECVLSLLIFCILFLSSNILLASSVTFEQDVKFEKKVMSIRNIFKAIKQQTSYDVIWQTKSFNADRQILLQNTTLTLPKVLKLCIANTNCDYILSDKSIIIVLSNNIKSATIQDSVMYAGQIRDEKGSPLSGATVKLLGSKKVTATNSSGHFALLGPRKGTLEITYIGYLTKQVTLNGLNIQNSITVTMTPGANTLGEVSVVSTGYQDLPKERATGSFEVITKEQLQHSTDPNLIRRLEGITTSMNFNNNLISNNSTYAPVAPTDPSRSPLANLTIRGKNTLNATLLSFGNQSGQVLVIIDGIASPYSIDNVNPDDVESLTVLKDAAAASIWGSRAANGVIVIKTKRSAINQPLSISFNTNFNITEKFDLFYTPRMSVSDFINAQMSQFEANGSSIPSPNVSFASRALSPVVEILGRRRRGEISQTQAAAQLDSLRRNDVRNDYNKYVLKNAASQNYSLSLGGGGKQISYNLSMNYSKENGTNRFSGSDRLGMSFNTVLRPFKNLTINPGISYFVRRSHNQATEQGLDVSPNNGVISPYSRLVDENGNPAAVPYRYRQAFVNLLATTYGPLVKDLTYKPLQNVNEGYYKTSYRDLNFNLATSYKFDQYLSANAIFNYTIGTNEQNRLNKVGSFYMRDLITFYTTADGTMNIPDGGTFRTNATDNRSLTGRVQVDYNRDFNEANNLTLLVGGEITQNKFLSNTFQYYGYNESTLATNTQLNFRDEVPTLWFSDFFSPTSRIPWETPYISDGTVRTLSFFSNAAYTFRKRYTLSASIRKDMSSQFGVGTNKGGTPFYSVGGKWNIANEDFYNIDWLPILQVRTTFGYNGNVNPLTSARPIITYGGTSAENQLPVAGEQGGSPSNKRLRPERTSTLNSGVDFGFKNGRISGSMEYYSKRTYDLIASNSIDPSSGFSQTTYNTANIHAWGADLTINTQNIRSGKFAWSTNILASYNRVVLAKIYTPQAKTALDVVQGGGNEGVDLSRIYGYRWAGLDPATGNPRGYLNGQPKSLTGTGGLNSYLELAGQPLSEARYFGSAVPVYFGSIRNTFTYGSFAVSANILYKLGYYFRRNLVDLVSYRQLFNPSGLNFIQGAEYASRWQRPGDETITNVPSSIFNSDAYRDQFYQLSEINVQKADHIRLQEVNLSYSIGAKKWFLKNPRLYANVSNMGIIIWRANRLGLDPDTYDYPTPRTYSFGFSANF